MLECWSVGVLESNALANRFSITPSLPYSITPFFNMAEETKNLETTMTAARGHRKERVGEVISDKMAKTIIVRVQRRFSHARYKKVVTAYSKFYAHDEKREAKVGDRVRIEETRPLSKTKRWRLVEVVARDSGVARVAV